MKTINLPAVLIAFLAVGLAGCGNKKTPATTETTPAPSTAAPAVENAEPAVATASDTTSAPPAASLGPTIFFEFDSSTLSDEARATLTENAEWLKQDPKRTLTIEGHTDEMGTAEYNVALGERRARAAYDYLVRLGVEPGRVEVISFGEEKPMAADDAQNRRAMFIATK